MFCIRLDKDEDQEYIEKYLKIPKRQSEAINQRTGRHKTKHTNQRAGRWFSPGPPVSTTNKTDRHDITGILLKVTLNTKKTTKQRNKQ